MTTYWALLINGRVMDSSSPVVSSSQPSPHMSLWEHRAHVCKPLRVHTTPECASALKCDELRQSYFDALASSKCIMGMHTCDETFVLVQSIKQDSFLLSQRIAPLTLDKFQHIELINWSQLSVSIIFLFETAPASTKNTSALNLLGLYPWFLTSNKLRWNDLTIPDYMK